MPNRKDERAEIIRMLALFASIQMLAPRRVGKTWLMHELVKDLRARGWLTVFVDVEGMGSEDEFLRELCRKIEEIGTSSQWVFNHLTQRLKQLTSGAWEGNPVAAIGRIDPKAFSEALVASLNTQGDTLILVDEISLFVKHQLERDEQATKQFLYHLRKLRQAYPNVRWLLTGSIGLDVVARRAGLQGALVGLDIFALKPFSEPSARNYLNALCETDSVRWPFEMDDAAFEFLVSELGWLAPYYLKLLADRIRPTGEMGQSGRPTAKIADIERAFDELLLPEYRGYFATWEEHIDKNFPREDAILLFEFLEICCEQAEGEAFATLQARLAGSHAALTPRDMKNLLTALANDGFLMDLNSRWRFRSGLLRRYWLRYQHS